MSKTELLPSCPNNKEIVIVKEVEELLQPAPKIDPTENKNLVDTCYDYAIKGEKLSQANDFAGSIKYFTAALYYGTDNYKLLSAIYCQLGNAFFSLQDYVHALDYHKWDLNISRLNNNLIEEAKASGNLGNTLKKLGKFDEAILCNQRQLDIVRQIKDKALELRSLYNLATAYMDKGISLRNRENAEENKTEELVCFAKAKEHFELNLKLSKELNDHAFEGVLEGSLGNIYYLQKDYTNAMIHYKRRLAIAKEFGDIRAKRRSRINLANTQMMAKDIIGALKNYLKAYQISMQLYELSLIPSICQQLGNCCVLLKRPLVAIIYHLRGLSISLLCDDNQTILNLLSDLIKDYFILNDHEFHRKSTILFAASSVLMKENENLILPSQDEIKKKISKYIDPEESIPDELIEESSKYRDKEWLEEEIKQIYSLIKEDHNNDGGKKESSLTEIEFPKDPEENKEHLDNVVFEHVISGLDMVVVTLQEDGKSCSRHPFKNPDQIIFETYDGDNKVIMNQIPSINSTFNPNTLNKANSSTELQTNSHEDFDRFLNLVSQVQSRRLDEQRCNLPISSITDASPDNRPRHEEVGNSNLNPQLRNSENNQENDENFFNLVDRIQSLRMDDQRASLPDFPGLIRVPSAARLALSPIGESGSVLRNGANQSSGVGSLNPGPSQGKTNKSGSHTNAAFFEMIMRCQADTRIDDQRSNLPTSTDTASSCSVPSQNLPLTSTNPTNINNNNNNNQDDFFDLVQKLQSNRYDEQRCYFPMLMNLPSTAPSNNLAQSSSVSTSNQSDSLEKKRKTR